MNSPLIPFDRQDPAKILFIGNSYTYYHAMPEILAGLSEAAGGPQLDVQWHTVPSCNFERHVLETRALEAIRGDAWDVVVLQDKSTGPVDNPELTWKYAPVLHEAAVEQGARTLLYLTWARQHLPEMQRTLDEVYYGVGREMGVPVAPVGRAWEASLQAKPDLTLHDADRSHPLPAGSYLAACVFYATLFGRSPESLPARIGDDEQTLVDVPPASAAHLQQIAWETVSQADEP